MTIPLSRVVDELFDEQLREWEAAKKAYTDLRNIQTRHLLFNNHQIILQYNPGRIVSSSAKVDPVSISERPCFLCSNNRPDQQRGVPFSLDYLILVNPYPVFNKHLTIPSVDHLPQRIEPHFEKMLLLAKDLPGFTIIYNGAKCGASAPDHFHFQAIPQGILPVETEFAAGIKTIYRGQLHHCSVYTWQDYLRKPVTITGDQHESLVWMFMQLYKILQHTDEEPMINMLMYFNSGKWIFHIFPRLKHRPDQYFYIEEQRLLVSPASIDMGGFMIMPREKDFKSITADVAADIYTQVCPDEKTIDGIVEKLMQA